VDTFSIKISVNELEKRKNFRELMKKLVRVIKSVQNAEQLYSARNYIDLWYKSYGEKHKTIIELYFKSKTNEVR
jgi:Iap family predicted aminopeptidase